uniref:Phosphatidylinositol 3-kinase regulatory subunit alpha n=1 Tax=Trichobilharzia regenti TaxID=157069 RepID=A0AA85IVR0_TRIRE|nr:unnamed protein product [Trichobilharzia regenti]
MTQNDVHCSDDLYTGRYTCISTFHQASLPVKECIDVVAGDVLVVETRPPNATAPKSFLYGINETTGSKGYFPAYCIDNHPSGSNVNSSLHVRSKSIDRLVPTPLSSISRPVSTTNVDTGHLSQPVIPRRYKRFVKLSSSLLPPVPIKSQSSRSCTNLSSLATQNALSYTSKNRNVSVPAFLYECHQFNNVSVSFPRLCVLCGDYVVTPRCNANQCLACKSLFHRVCAEFCKRFEKLPCRRETNTNVKGKPEKSANAYASDIFPLSSSSISTSEQPLVTWNRTQVAHWLAVVGFERFVGLFLQHNLDGSFVSEVTPDSPCLRQIIDPFACEALKQAILVLQGKEPGPGEDLSIFTQLERKEIRLERIIASREHDFRLTSFFRIVACVVCKIPLLGFSHQGFQCKKCGAICHRICKVLDCFLDCPGEFLATGSSIHDEMNEVPTSLVPYTSQYFGVKLEDQKLDPISKLPAFLTACTEQIEKVATESFTTASNNPHTQPIDMLMVYQQSASAHTLQELHNTFAHCLPLPDTEESSLRPLDIVRSAQLLKAFLRDLPISVIPEDNYLDFCNLANIKNSNEKPTAVQKFLDSLPEIHRLCLIHIFNHLGFVVNHQNKLKTFSSGVSLVNVNQSSSFSASIKGRPNDSFPWLMLFRQILVRPPWHLITDIAMGMDTHLRALETLFSVVVDASVADELEVTSEVKNSPLNPYVLDTGYQVDDVCDPKTKYGHQSSDDTAIVPTISTPPSPSSTAANKKDLENQEWYWGDITQEEVREIMAGLQDGYFLVRDASERSVAAFTLVVRWQGQNKLNRIYHRGEYFGLTDPPHPTFRLVSELINFCRSHPLNLSNYRSLRLIWPVSHRHKRFNGKADASSNNDSSNNNNNNNISGENRRSADGVFACFLSDSQLSSELKKTAVEISQLDKLIADLELQSKSAIELKEDAVRLIKAYKNVYKWLQISLSRLNNYSYPSEKLKISPQIETLKNEMSEVEQKIKENKEEVNEQCKKARVVFEKYANAISRQRKLKRQTQEIRRALKDRGIKAESLSGSNSSLDSGCISSANRLVDTQTGEMGSMKQDIQSHVFINFDDASVPEEIRDRRYWFLTDVTRQRVEELLTDRPPGTFVVRPSTAGNKLALGVRLESSVQHCLIHCINGKYGFVEKSCTFDSLEDLVCYHHVHDLKRYNKVLNTTLKYPIKLHLNE